MKNFILILSILALPMIPEQLTSVIGRTITSGASAIPQSRTGASRLAVAIPLPAISHPSGQVIDALPIPIFPASKVAELSQLPSERQIITSGMSGTQSRADVANQQTRNWESISQAAEVQPERLGKGAIPPKSRQPRKRLLEDTPTQRAPKKPARKTKNEKTGPALVPKVEPLPLPNQEPFVFPKSEPIALSRPGPVRVQQSSPAPAVSQFNLPSNEAFLKELEEFYKPEGGWNFVDAFSPKEWQFFRKDLKLSNEEIFRIDPVEYHKATKSKFLLEPGQIPSLAQVSQLRMVPSAKSGAAGQVTSLQYASRIAGNRLSNPSRDTPSHQGPDRDILRQFREWAS